MSVVVVQTPRPSSLSSVRRPNGSLWPRCRKGYGARTRLLRIRMATRRVLIGAWTTYRARRETPLGKTTNPKLEVQKYLARIDLGPGSSRIRPCTASRTVCPHKDQ